ncbi:MAG: carboxypeptidase regulatory-like domain-containing protein, partial [Bacteroidia bacterium]|nr:carboxypeptidase regulatory-like domain-containing protein [Bacteroidia bacterium]
MFRFICLLFCFIIVAPQVRAQIKKAEINYQNHQYNKAVYYYKKIIDKPGNQEYLYNLGDSYFKLKDYKNAQLYFNRYINEAPKENTLVTTYDTVLVENKNDPAITDKKITSSQTNELHPKRKSVYLQLGECLLNNNQYDEARKYFITYLRTNPNDKRGQLFSRACDDIKTWASMPARYDVYSIPKLNSKYSDFSAVEYKGGLVFVSDRREDILNENTDGFSQSPFLSMMFTKFRSPNDSLSFGRVKEFLVKYKGDYHTGPICFNKDQTEIYISRVDEIKGRKADKNMLNKPKLFYAFYKDGKWVELFPFPFNDDKYLIAHPSISDDGKYLFFTSDMPGGFGGTDIWYSVRENQTWQTPINAGTEINTAGNESFPFISSTNTLYFSSDGHPGLGGLDIFSSSFLEQVFSPAINLKANINSSFDDFGIYFKTDNKGGYFSSNRTGGVGKDDIYGFKVNNNIVNITGKILLTDNIKDGAESVKILLMTQDGKVLQSTTTDNSGFFKFENISSDQFYLVKVDENDPLLRKQKKLYMADETNRIVRVTVISDNGYFTFENIPSDLTTLDAIELDDIVLKSNLLNGFLVNGDDSTIITNVKVFLNGERGEAVQSRITDKRGYFAFNNISSEKNYHLSIDENNPVIQKLSKILIKDKLGRVILSLQKNANQKFDYYLIKTEQTNLALIDEEEPGINRSFKGKLIDSDANTPIAGAQIILQTNQDEILQTTVTDEFGNFKFYNVLTNLDLKIKTLIDDPALKQSKHIKITDADGRVLFYAELKKDGFTFEVLKTDPNFLSVLEVPEAPLTKKQVSGKLLGDGATPIAGAEVYMKDEQGNVIGRTTTDARGNFKFQNLPPDNNFLIALNESDPTLKNFNTVSIYDRKGKEIFKGGKFIGKFSFTVLKEEATYLSLIENVPDTKIKKRVVGTLVNGDGSNTSIANAEVWLLNANGDLIDKTKTDTKGNFSFKNLSSEENYLFTINPDDPAVKTIGRVVLKDQKGNELYASKKDESGKFVFSVLATDNHLLSSMDAADIRLSKNLSGFLLAGDGDNAPVDGATVKLVNNSGIMVATTTSANNGKFRFSNLRSDETYHVVIDESDPALKKYKNVILTDNTGKVLFTAQKSKEGFKFDILKSDQNMLSLLDNNDVTLKHELKGYIINEETGAVVSGANVILNDKLNQTVASVKTNNKGFFRFSNLDNDQDYLINLDENDPALKGIGKLVIKDGSGNIILKTDHKTGYGFTFNVLASDASTLSLMEIEDTRIKIDIDGLLLSDEVKRIPLKNIEVG